MTNKLCCVLNPYVKNRSKRICLPCLKGAIKAELVKNIDWGKEAHKMARAQNEYLNDDHSGGWYELYWEFSSAWSKMEKIVKKIAGPNAYELVHDEVEDIASEIFNDLQDKAMRRVKIVVT